MVGLVVGRMVGVPVLGATVWPVGAKVGRRVGVFGAWE